MLRLGLALSKSARGGLLLPQQTSATQICAPALTTLQVRTMAKAKDGAAGKRTKYITKVKVSKARVKSGTRLKRTHWLDTPRKRKVIRSSPLLIRRTYLNNDKNVTKFVGKLVKSEKRPPAYRLIELAKQVKVTPENAAALTDLALKHDLTTAKSYHALLDLCYRRKDVDRATALMAEMKKQKQVTLSVNYKDGVQGAKRDLNLQVKVTDQAYSIYAKILATRGQLDKAKEVLEEREANTSIIGSETMATMINYYAADNISEGIALFERYKKKYKKADRYLYSTIIGWALKHGDLEAAEKYYKMFRFNYLRSAYKPALNDADYDARVAKFESAQSDRHKLLTDWVLAMRKADSNHFDESSLNLEDKAVKKMALGPNKKPKLPAVPVYPHRLTEEEFLEKFPVPITAHIIRPLIDIEQAGKEIPAEWIPRLSKGLGWKKAKKHVNGLAHKIYLKDKTRYEHLKSVLTKLGLPAEELVHIPPPKVKGVAPLPRSKVPATKKWWKKGRTVFEKYD